MTRPTNVRITEVGPRDGLQNEARTVPVETKVAFIDALGDAGVDEIEVTSFVSPKWVPQLADAGDVLSRITRRPGVVYSALVPNMKGMERALESTIDKIAVFTAASETFSQRNTNATIAETIDRFRTVVDAARAASLPVRGYVSCVVECPYEGVIAPRAVRDVVQQLVDLGVNDIDLGETIGVASPDDIARLLDVVGEVVPLGEITLHMHDTRGTAIACIYRALEMGVHSFDAACMGLGGCPYAPGAAGNVATERLVYACERIGIETGVSFEALHAAGCVIGPSVGRTVSTGVFCTTSSIDDGAR